MVIDSYPTMVTVFLQSSLGLIQNHNLQICIFYSSVSHLLEKLTPALVVPPATSRVKHHSRQLGY